MENEFGLFKTKFFYCLTKQQDWPSSQVVFLFENCQRKAEIEFSERWAQGACTDGALDKDNPGGKVSALPV